MILHQVLEIHCFHWSSVPGVKTRHGSRDYLSLKSITTSPPKSIHLANLWTARPTNIAVSVFMAVFTSGSHSGGDNALCVVYYSVSTAISILFYLAIYRCCCCTVVHSELPRGGPLGSGYTATIPWLLITLIGTDTRHCRIQAEGIHASHLWMGW